MILMKKFLKHFALHPILMFLNLTEKFDNEVYKKKRKR